MTFIEKYGDTAKGVLFVAVFAAAATYIADLPFFTHLHLSPLIIGLVMGIAYANTLRNRLPAAWTPGIIFSTKRILRLAIIFYGFRITFQDILSVGAAGIAVSILMVGLTFIIGYLVGTRLFKIDRDTTILTCAGSSICGAAAVLATESVLKAAPYKGAVAVATVVLFGTIAMFLYPFMYRMGLVPLTPEDMGIYIGGSVHEVAHVVAAGNAIGPEAADPAVIVKMIRVLLIAPFLLILGFWLVKTGTVDDTEGRQSIVIPWFAILFIGVAIFHSFALLPTAAVGTINAVDTFALTMAMSALGMETNAAKFKGVGLRPIYLAAFLFVWLIFGGYGLTVLATTLF
ncbi:MAG: YeiH family putative sulfate export transporter [Rhodospirillales bacterium]|nr:YeiH family putative sulfate export transporter [Rhodospirillales bacterium]